MSKTIKKIIGIVLVILGVLVSLYFTNKEYINYKISGKENSYIINREDITFYNWQKTEDDTYIAERGSNIVFGLSNPKAKRITLNATISKKEFSTVIYLLTGDQEEFAEDNTLKPSMKTNKNNEYYFDIDRTDLKSLRIDMTDEAGFSMDLKSISVDINRIQIGWLSLLMTLAITILLAILLQIPLYKYKDIPIYLRGLEKYQFLLFNLVKKDIVTKYRRSFLGVLWSVLNPMLMMLVITAVFQNIFKQQIENFPIYYLTGSLIFNFNSEATNATMGSMLEAGPLIKKVYIPKYIFPMEKCLFALVNLFFSLIAVIFICIVLRFRPPITAFLAIVPIIYVFVFSLGFGLILATLNVFFRDISHLYGVLVTAWMYLTPIIYPADILPGWMMQIMRVNPLYYYVEYFRSVMMYGVIPDLRFNLICIFFSVSFLMMGILIFKKNQDKFILYI